MIVADSLDLVGSLSMRKSWHDSYFQQASEAWICYYLQLYKHDKLYLYVQVFVSLPKGEIILTSFVPEDSLGNVTQNGQTPLLLCYLS